ncbi:MAG TPA: ABC transporter ATP-binding protein [Polyangiaceae bacterium]|jgi:oligopeptide/dipeptide ABC transporter ATP-binding protein|nr:ABC transporter ATP-binding protein [Polyangiaceae bacterium]
MSEAASALPFTEPDVPLLEVTGLRKYFPVRGGIFGKVANHVHAVEDVSFSIKKGQTLGLVGESGCGKTTVGRLVLRLLEPTAGSVRFAGEDLLQLSPARLRQMRRRMQIVFQDPYSSLNPRRTVGDAIGEPLFVHGLARGAALDQRVAELLERVGLPGSYRSRYPHEFSGGQRQRVCIARALALGPELVVCDEAVSALDISIQAQILNLLSDLQDEYGLTYLFISHNLNVVRHIADRIAVMYLGNLVEVADADELFESPLHPYTRALMSANPVPDPDVPLRPVFLKGELPSPLDPPSGCRFHTRCPNAFEPCSSVVPEARLTRAASGAAHSTEEHRVWCHLYDDAAKPD